MQKYQTFSKRFWASILDSLLIAIPMGLMDSLFGSVGLSKSLLIIWAIVSYLAYNVYTILMHGIYGQTLGKMVTKVKVVDITESPMTMRQSVLRDGVWLLLSIGFIGNRIYLILNGLPSTGNAAVTAGYVGMGGSGCIDIPN
jgi:uncharacterized RDD family membrane protein YckC